MWDCTSTPADWLSDSDPLISGSRLGALPSQKNVFQVVGTDESSYTFTMLGGASFMRAINVYGNKKSLLRRTLVHFAWMLGL